MPSRKTPCQLHPAGSSPFGNDLSAGRYLSAVATPDLPREKNTEAHIIRRGYAVGFGQWFFFPALEPAIAFGRAARMSLDCSGYGVYEAAHETVHCLDHGDERVLHVDTSASLDRRDDEVELLKRFTQSVKEHAWSAGWHTPAGYITDYNNGRPAKTRSRSLPL